MKIIFAGRYNSSEALTGPEKVAKRIFAGYTKTNESVFVEYFFDGNKYGFFKKLFGSELVSESFNSKVLRKGILTFLFFLVKYKPDIIHIITYERFTITAFLYKLLFRAKIVYNVHGIIIHENLKYKKVKKLYFIKDKICEHFLMKYSDALLFLSENSVNIASGYYTLNQNRIHILPNGIDEIFYSAGKQKVFTKSDKLKFIFNGNVNRKEKGFDFLAETLNKLNFPIELFLIGNNEIPVNAQNLNCISLPFTDTENYSRYLSDKAIFISSSEYEPFSISAVEAMAAGLVPVVTNQTGMKRYIINNVNGFCFDFGDSEELVKILSNLNEDKNSVERISISSKEIYSLLNWESVLEQYKDVYRQIAKS